MTADVAGEQTDLKLTYDADHLYVGYIARLTDPTTLTAKVRDPRIDAGIFSDDCLELFLSAPVSAVQPFGNSDVALARTSWQYFTAAICQSVNEPMGLPIRDLVLKKSPEHDVKLDLVIKW